MRSSGSRLGRGDGTFSAEAIFLPVHDVCTDLPSQARLMLLMQILSVCFFGLSCLTLALGILGRVAERPVLGMTPRALLDVTRTCLLFSIAAALI